MSAFNKQRNAYGLRELSMEAANKKAAIAFAKQLAESSIHAIGSLLFIISLPEPISADAFFNLWDENRHYIGQALQYIELDFRQYYQHQTSFGNNKDSQIETQAHDTRTH